MGFLQADYLEYQIISFPPGLKEAKCPPCAPCARCPEPSFECKKVPNYNAIDNQYLPQPILMLPRWPKYSCVYEAVVMYTQPYLYICIFSSGFTIVAGV